MKATLGELANATDGRTNTPTVTIDGATQDSRAVEPGMLFVPLLAERDGHDFIEGAAAAGAAAYVTSREPISSQPHSLHVDDTGAALDSLGKWARSQISGPVIGITGSVGKTSTKDLLAALLAGSFSVHASEKSFNNEIGVPLTLLNAPDGTNAAVVEMGARGIGHIAALCDIASPTVGVITTVAPAHTGEFGSLEAIALAKGELVEALPSDGLAVLNADVDRVTAMSKRTSARCLTFGHSPNADIHITHVRSSDDLSLTIGFETPWGSLTVEPPVRGAHLAGNVAAAVATALALDVAPNEVQERIEQVVLSPWRMELSKTSTGAVIINDAYNANPASMEGALRSLAGMSQRRKVALLGYMAELGPDEADAHRAVARLAAELDIEVLAVGTALYGREVTVVDDSLEAIGTPGLDTAVLVKGSRSAGLEVVADELSAL